MSDTKFTPGPWSQDYCDVDEVWHVDAGAYPFGSTICEVGQRTIREGDAQANARLIAAAPALFNALSELIDGFPLPVTVNEYELVQSGCDPTEARKIANAVAALKRARGEA